MPSIALTLTLCLLTGFSRILLKKGLESSNAVTGMVASLIIGAIALCVLTIATVPLDAYNWQGIAFFAMIGCVAPPLVRYLTYIGVERLGASRSDPIRSLTPFFAILFAVLFLGEKAGPSLVFGAILIFVGILILSIDAREIGRTSKNWRSSDLLFPAAAAVIAGGVANLRKVGTGMLPSPLLAATAAAVSAVFVFAAFLAVTGKWKSLSVDRISGKYFLIAGLCTGATDVLDIILLQQSSVSVVVPLLAASPLIVILLSHFFLKGIETITWKLALSALITSIGVGLISAAAIGGVK